LTHPIFCDYHKKIFGSSPKELAMREGFKAAGLQEGFKGRGAEENAEELQRA
jgi:hypothetical protein